MDYGIQFTPRDGEHGVAWLPSSLEVPMAVLILLVQSDAENDVRGRNGVAAQCTLLKLALDALADVSGEESALLRMHIRARLAHTHALCSTEDPSYDTHVEEAVFRYWQAGRDALDAWHNGQSNTNAVLLVSDTGRESGKREQIRGAAVSIPAKAMLSYAVRWFWSAIVTVQRMKRAQELKNSVHYYILSALEMAYLKLDFPAKSLDTVQDTWTCANITSKYELLERYNAKLLAFSEYISICYKPDANVTTAATDSALKRLVCYNNNYKTFNPKERVSLHFSAKLQALWETFELQLLGAHFRACVQEDADRVVHSAADCERLAASLEVKYEQYIHVISGWNGNCKERLAFVEWLTKRVVTQQPSSSSSSSSTNGVDVVPAAP